MLPLSALAERRDVPVGFRVSIDRRVASGVRYQVLQRREPPLIAHVARVSPGAPFAWRVVQAGNTLGGDVRSVERSSAMCRRAGCLLGSNGDFFTSQGMPLGGVVVGDEAVRSPNARHHQIAIEASGALRATPMSWTVTLVPSDLEEVEIGGVNVERARDALVLYTSRGGASTGTNGYGAELVGRFADVDGVLRVGRTLVVRLESFRPAGGNSAIPSDGFVLSGHGRGAASLAALWTRVRAGVASNDALLRVTSTPDTVETVGGTPILLRDGKRWFADEPRDFLRKRAPRTILGWRSDGTQILVTVDGRQAGYSLGVSLSEAASLMRALGATDAINLDGGGSTTFVLRGRVANRPSDRLVLRAEARALVNVVRPSDRVLANVERPVSNSLMLVPTTPAARAALAAVRDAPVARLVLPDGSPTPTPESEAVDPASMPAIVIGAYAGPSNDPTPAAIGTLVAVASALGARARRRRLQRA